MKKYNKLILKGVLNVLFMNQLFWYSSPLREQDGQKESLRWTQRVNDYIIVIELCQFLPYLLAHK